LGTLRCNTYAHALSLHDALPISWRSGRGPGGRDQVVELVAAPLGVPSCTDSEQGAEFLSALCRITFSNSEGGGQIGSAHEVDAVVAQDLYCSLDRSLRRGSKGLFLLLGGGFVHDAPDELVLEVESSDQRGWSVGEENGLALDVGVQECWVDRRHGFEVRVAERHLGGSRGCHVEAHPVEELVPHHHRNCVR